MGYTSFMSPRKITSILLLLVVLVGLIWFSRTQNKSLESDKKAYKSISYGISFLYPENYFLEERPAGNGERSRFNIILTENTEENRLVREGKTPGREGPVSISVNIFQNLENQPIESWVRGMSDSNYKLGNGELLPVTIGGNNALSYRWSGLYEGNSVVLSHKGNIIMMSTTFLSPTDPIVDIFESILETTTLE